MSSSSNSAGTDLTLPPSETVASNGTIDVSGVSYTDSFAAGNAGAMYLSISDASGDLWGYYPSGSSNMAVSGNGTNRITFQGSYADVQDILSSLTYAATTSSGSDSINFDLWNQAGTETTGSIPVSIGGTSSAGGASETWTGAISTDWNTAGNWSGGVVPGSGDTAVITGGVTNTPTLSNTVLNNETILFVMPAEPQSGPTIDLSGVTLGSGSTIETSNPPNSQLASYIFVENRFTVAAGATVKPEAGATQAILDNTTNDVVVNNGSIVQTFLGLQQGGTFVNSGLFADAGIVGGRVINDGTILADQNGGAALDSNVLLIGGTVDIAGSGFSMSGTFFETDVNFSGTGDLGLSQALDFTNGASITGFGAGDYIVVSGPATMPGGRLSLTDGTLDLGAGGTITTSIPISGSYTVGNFEEFLGDGLPSAIAYAGNDAFSNTGESVDIAAPAQEAVTQGGTLLLNDVTIDNSSTYSITVGITAASGALYMNGATGSGTDHLTITGSTAQVNADLASLSYVAGTGSDTIEITANINYPSASAAAVREIPVTVNANSSGPALSEPYSESVAPGGTIAVQGTYYDSFAASNPGSMYLSISDTTGKLYAEYGQQYGQIVEEMQAPGSGTNSITFQGSYGQVDAILNTLSYAAGANAGSDSIHFDLWNQAGVETTGIVPVSVTAGGGGGSGPTLTEPASETVAPSGTVAVSGSYSDSFAQSNPGQLYLGISDSSGTLTATDASGNAVAGSGTNSISLPTDYVDLNAILASLHYTAGGSSGTDTISFDIWNQAGSESTGATAITIGTPSNASMTMADFTSPTSNTTMSPSGSTQSGSYGPADTTPTMTMPPILHTT